MEDNELESILYCTPLKNEDKHSTTGFEGFMPVSPTVIVYHETFLIDNQYYDGTYDIDTDSFDYGVS